MTPMTEPQLHQQALLFWKQQTLQPTSRRHGSCGRQVQQDATAAHGLTHFQSACLLERGNAFCLLQHKLLQTHSICPELPRTCTCFCCLNSIGLDGSAVQHCRLNKLVSKQAGASASHLSSVLRKRQHWLQMLYKWLAFCVLAC